MKEYVLVDKLSEVRENIKRFNEGLKEDEWLVGMLSRFRQWYYDRESDMFGPSKFIGYKNMDAFRYRNKKGYGTDGRKTEEILKKMSYNVSSEDEYNLYSRLEDMLGQFDKKPNKATKIKVLEQYN